MGRWGAVYKLSRRELEERSEQRGQYAEEARWYGVMAHVGRERRVRDELARLEAKGVVEEVLLPEMQGALGVCPAGGERELLFPSYLFVNCRMTDSIYMRVCELGGVVKIVGRAWRIPTAIDEVEIDHLRGVLNACERPRLVCKLSAGQRVVIRGGLMDGLRGRVVGGNARNVKVEVGFSFLDSGRAVRVTVPREAVREEGSADDLEGEAWGVAAGF